MRLILTFVLVIVVGATTFSQNLFSPISLDQVPLEVKSGERGIIPAEYTAFSINFEGLMQTLQGDQSAEGQSFLFPVDKDQQLAFTMVELAMMHPKLQAKFPSIRTFKGNSENGAYSLFINYGPLGTHAVLRSSNDIKYFIPFAEGVTTHGILCSRKDYIPTAGIPLQCGNDEYTIVNNDEPLSDMEFAHVGVEKDGDPVSLRTYSVAVAGTSEFTALKGSVANALAAINTALMVLNEIYHREMAIDFQLIADNEQLIYTDSNTDPYTAPSDAAGLLAQNQVNLDNTLGTANYDIGHVFTIGCINNLGGIAALGSVCNNQTKGRGVTCHSNQNVSMIVSEIMAHEIGHSFNATHSWNKCSTLFQPQVEPGTAFEPGSGSTIMSYNGACGSNNISNNSDAYFHVVSLEQMYAFRTTGNASSCGTESGSNASPDIVIVSPANVVIPISTPFKLTATATDPEGHGLNYCWEQYNLGPTADLGSPVGDGPSFRSFPPTSNPTRYLPRLANVLAGVDTPVERLPTYSREFTFKCTVRDLFLPNAAASWEEISFSASDAAGPFKVTGPSISANWEAGSEQTVTWDVANTDQAPVNCQTVNIWLSTDGGQNFDTPLLMNTPNDGSADIVVAPGLATTTARVMVEANDNIFFNVGGANFTISDAAAPGLYLAFEGNISEEVICLPGTVSFNMLTEGLSGFNTAVNYSVTGLPSGATSSFSQNPSLPSDNLTMTIDFDGTVGLGTYPLVLTAEAAGLTTVNRNFTIFAIDQDFSSLAVTSPANGATGVAENSSISWTNLPNSDSYDVRISTSPAFDVDLVEGNNIFGTSFTPSQPFEKSTLYYVQVRGRNFCAEGDWTDLSIFQTENFSCNVLTQSEDLTLAAGIDVAESSLDVALNGTISDINVSLLDVSYFPINSLIVSLVSPAGTEEILYNKKCGSENGIQIGFDSDANNPFPCPANTGGTFLPDGGDLSNFIGESTQGTWKMKVETTVNAFDPGTLNEWSLEFCSNFTPTAPFLVVNETINVKTNDAQWVSPDKLRVDHDVAGPTELVYTIVKAPTAGILEWASSSPPVIELGLGDTFTQNDIDSYYLKYVDGASDASSDSFDFIVSEANGGTLGPLTFNINIGDGFDPISGIQELPEEDFSIFPNPTDQLMHIQSTRQQTMRTISVFGGQGQQIGQFDWANGASFELITKNYPAGVYFLRIQEGEAFLSKRFTVIR